MNKPLKVADELAAMDSIDFAMANAFAEIEAVAKDKVNPHFKSKYADLGSVIDGLRPILAKHGLYFLQCPEPSEDGVVVTTVLRHRSGESIGLGKLFVPANKRDAQGFGSALTYARRYALVTAFGVPTEDDDGNAAARTTANPTTGETPPAKRVPLDGPYTSATALKTAAREFVRTLEGMGDLDEFIAWSETTDYAEFCAQLQKDMPDWWQGGPSVPAEFVPLEIRIRQRREDLEKLEGVR